MLRLALAAGAALATAAGASACGKRQDMDRERAAALFTEIEVATAPGLSGLATDATGALWTIAERAATAYRIELADTPPAGGSGAGSGAVRALQAFPVEGVPAGVDLEGIAALGGERFALGTEGHDDGVAAVLLAERRGAALAVTRTIVMPERAVGMPLKKNQGAEGVCGAGDTILAAIEGAAEDGGRRWAPVLRIAGGEIVRRHRLWLTTQTGKISGLDCQIAADGSARAWAIERHFEVTRVLRFELPPPGQGADDVTPTVALDLDKILNGKLNLEGVAVLPDGRVVAVVDNQWKTITGPSELLVLRPDALH